MERFFTPDPYRRGSHGKSITEMFTSHPLTTACVDESTMPHTRKFLIQVEPTLQSLQAQEDTDQNMQITIEDNGPKVRKPSKDAA